MTSTEIILMILPSAVAIVGVWVNLNREIEKLKGRIIRVESDKDELKDMMKEVVKAVHKIELMLAERCDTLNYENSIHPMLPARVV